MMNKPEIKLYTLDLTGKNTDNLVIREYREKTLVDNNYIFVPFNGPFYQKSVVMERPDGRELIYKKDWEFYSIAGRLTNFVKDKTVGIFIRILNKELTEWTVTYQVVGNFNIIDQSVIRMFEDAINGDGPILWKNIKNKPLWFIPSIHKHDLAYQFHSFQDIIEQVLRIPSAIEHNTDRALGEIEAFKSAIDQYIYNFKAAIVEIIEGHDNEKIAPRYNSHGLTKLQIGLENVDNFSTADLLQALDGVRDDLHLTADVALKVVQEAKGTSASLFPSGVIPLLRYGSNSFIPPSIAGSFEGLGGGGDMRFGYNKEADGTSLILMNRANGRVNGLYFMRTKTPEIPSTWSFTGYQYKHPTAESLGVNLRTIINGSSGKMLIVGDGKRYFWALGNGTLDPSKHVLVEIPSGGSITDSELCVENIINLPGCNLLTFPNSDRILLVQHVPLQHIINNFPEIEQEFVNGNTNLSSYMDAFWDRMGGFRIWEFDRTNSRWEPIWFNYTRVGRDDETPITSLFYSPYKFVGTDKKDTGNGRIGGCVSEYQFIFEPYGARSCGAARMYHVAGRDEPENKRFAIRFSSTFFLLNNSNTDIGAPNWSAGFGFKNKYYKNGKAFYQVERSSSLSKLYKFNLNKNYRSTENEEARINGPLMETSTLSSITASVYTGQNVIRMSSMTNYSLPLLLEWDGFRDVIGYDYRDMLEGRSGSNRETFRKAAVIVEKTPINIGVNPLNQGYIHLDINDENTYFSVLKVETGDNKNFKARRLPALSLNGLPKQPNVNFDFINSAFTPYKADGYGLENDVRIVNHNPLFGLITQNFDNLAQKKQWQELSFCFGAISSANNIESNPNISTVNNENVGYIYPYKVTKKWDNESITFETKEQIDIESVIKDTLIPSLSKVVIADTTLSSAGITYNLNNLPSRWTITPFVTTTNKLCFLVVMYIELSTNNARYYYNTFTMDQFTQLDSITKKCIKSTILSNWGFYTSGSWSPAVTENYLKDNSKVNLINVNDYRTLGTFSTFISNKNLNGKDTLVILAGPHFYRITSDGYQVHLSVNTDSNGVIKDGWFSNNYYQNVPSRYILHPYYGVVKPAAQSYMGMAGYVGRLFKYGTEDGTLYDSLKSSSDQGEKFVLCDSNLIDGAYTVYYQSEVTIMLSGKNYTLSPSFKDLYDITPSPQDKTFYIYVKFVGGEPLYDITEYPLPETPSQAYIGTIKTNKDAIYEIMVFNAFTLNGFRINQDRRGSSIPASTGTILEQGELASWNEFD